MNVLSLFNGMSFCSMALESLGVNVNKMYSSEIDKYANQATQAIFPDTIQLGDILNWRAWWLDWSSIDLVAGGFPCQAWSMAGKQLGDKDERGMLFWTMLDIIKHAKEQNPNIQFLIENVKMKKEFEQYITAHTESALGKVYKILINSALVSAQNRNRYYWTSFEVTQPEDKGILLKDIIEHDGDYTYMSDKFINRQQGRKCLRDDLDGKAVNLSAMEYVKNGRQGDYIKCAAQRGRYITGSSGKTEQRLEIRKDNKTSTLTTVQKDNYVVVNTSYRKLTPREYFRLQTVPEYLIDILLGAGISNTQLYKMCGNGFTMLVIKHILSCKY